MCSLGLGLGAVMSLPPFISGPVQWSLSAPWLLGNRGPFLQASPPGLPFETALLTDIQEVLCHFGLGSQELSEHPLCVRPPVSSNMCWALSWVGFVLKLVLALPQSTGSLGVLYFSHSSHHISFPGLCGSACPLELEGNHPFTRGSAQLYTFHC